MSKDRPTCGHYSDRGGCLPCRYYAPEAKNNTFIGDRCNKPIISIKVFPGTVEVSRTATHEEDAIFT